MKNLALVGIVMLGIGFAIGWVAKPVSEPKVVAVAMHAPAAKTENSPASKVPGVPYPPAGKHAIREPESKKPANVPSDEQMKQAKDMQAGMAKAMVKRTRGKYDLEIDRLVEKLNLSPDQKAKMVTWLDNKMKDVEKLDFSDPKSFSGMADPNAFPTEKALLDALSPTLTAEQKDGLAQVQEADHQSKVDAAALKSLSKLQGVIQFDEGQRDEVYKILTQSAETSVNSESDKPDLAKMFTDGMGIEMDPYDLGLTNLMTESAMDPEQMKGATDPKQVMANMRDAINKRIDQRVELLRPVLNDKQLELYRNELKTKGMGVYGSVFTSQGLGE